MIVIISPRAEADLNGIGIWIARENAARAITFVADLRRACDRVGEVPRLHPFVEGSRSLRKVSARPYLIFYRIRPDHVFIVTVRHGARDNGFLR